MNKIDLKPLSVNECWKGRRFKTEKYKQFEKAVFYSLPKLGDLKPPFELSYEFGFSNPGSDLDNPIKPFTDILQKKYKFNDRDIYKLNAEKVIVGKGKEYIKFKIKEL